MDDLAEDAGVQKELHIPLWFVARVPPRPALHHGPYALGAFGSLVLRERRGRIIGTSAHEAAVAARAEDPLGAASILWMS